jgi:hypothetical protein
MIRGLAGFTLGLIFSVGIALPAQEPTDSTTRWMLEINYNGEVSYSEVGDEGAILFGPTPSEGDEKPSRQISLQLSYSRPVEDTVPLQVSLRFRATSQEASVVPVGNYVVRPTEPVILSELAGYGLKVAQVKLVTARPSGFVAPKIVNRTASLAVESLDANREEYRVLVRNNSSIPVSATVFLAAGANGICDVHRQVGFNGTFIEPGGTRMVEFPLPGAEKNYFGPGGESCSVSSSAKDDIAEASGAPRIVVDAVTFSDGTYEGDDSKAAMLAAEQLGRETQQQRIATLVEEAVHNSGATDAARMALLTSQVPALSEEPGPEMVDSIIARFPGLPDDARNSIRRDEKSALEYEKHNFLSQLKLFEVEASSRPEADLSLEQWWNATKAHCDYFVPSCRVQ